MRKYDSFWQAMAADLKLSDQAAIELEELLDTFAPQGICADELAGAILRFAQGYERKAGYPGGRKPPEDVPGQLPMFPPSVVRWM